MKATSRMARPLLAVISIQLALGPQAAVAQTAPVPTPADARTVIATSANGTPVVNIAAPNAAGVSHNRFNSYDVGTNGLILNNSSVNAVSLIGGGTAANANLAGRSAASLILNEVVAPNSGSLLAGYQEILGPSAELVIANPWGITCSGCGFVNTPRVTLTTGTPTLGANGALSGFTITGGQVAITGNGLDATRQTALDLIARGISVAGNVIVGSQANGVSGDLQLVAGTNQFDYATRTAMALPGSGAPPQFAIDSSILGGMYADRIRLLVTEQGAGVRLAGGIAALADDLTIAANGRIELRGTTTAAADVTIQGGDVLVQLTDPNTYLYGGRDLNITASGALDLSTGSVGSGRNMTLTATSLTDSGGANDQRFTGDGGSLQATVTDTIDLAGGYWIAPKLAFNASAVNVGGSATLFGSS
jgi:filamentous hemagglutinin